MSESEPVIDSREAHFLELLANLEAASRALDERPDDARRSHCMIAWRELDRALNCLPQSLADRWGKVGERHLARMTTKIEQSHGRQLPASVEMLRYSLRDVCFATSRLIAISQEAHQKVITDGGPVHCEWPGEKPSNAKNCRPKDHTILANEAEWMRRELGWPKLLDQLQHAAIVFWCSWDEAQRDLEALPADVIAQIKSGTQSEWDYRVRWLLERLSQWCLWSRPRARDAEPEPDLALLFREIQSPGVPDLNAELRELNAKDADLKAVRIRAAESVELLGTTKAREISRSNTENANSKAESAIRAPDLILSLVAKREFPVQLTATELAALGVFLKQCPTLEDIEMKLNVANIWPAVYSLSPDVTNPFFKLNALEKQGYKFGVPEIGYLWRVFELNQQISMPSPTILDELHLAEAFQEAVPQKQKEKPFLYVKQGKSWKRLQGVASLKFHMTDDAGTKHEITVDEFAAIATANGEAVIRSIAGEEHTPALRQLMASIWPEFVEPFVRDESAIWWRADRRFRAWLNCRMPASHSAWNELILKASLTLPEQLTDKWLIDNLIPHLKIRWEKYADSVRGLVNLIIELVAQKRKIIGLPGEFEEHWQIHSAFLWDSEEWKTLQRLDGLLRQKSEAQGINQVVLINAPIINGYEVNSFGWCRLPLDMMHYGSLDDGIRFLNPLPTDEWFEAMRSLYREGSRNSVEKRPPLNAGVLVPEVDRSISTIIEASTIENAASAVEKPKLTSAAKRTSRKLPKVLRREKVGRPPNRETGLSHEDEDRIRQKWDERPSRVRTIEEWVRLTGERKSLETIELAIKLSRERERKREGNKRK